MSDLAELVESLKRAVAVPGTFFDVFPSTTDDDLTATLADAFAEAQLDGFLSTVELDLGTNITTPDLELSHQALVVIYAGYRILVNEVRNRKNRTNYVAGPVQAEEEQTASMLNEVLRQLGERKKDLVARAERGELYSGGAFVLDLAYVKATADYAWHSGLSLHEYEGLV